MKQRLLTALLLLSAYSGFSQPTPPKSTSLGPATPSGNVIIPTAQARIIADALVRFEAIKPAYIERGKALRLKDAALAELKGALVAKDTLAASYERSLADSQRLRLYEQEQRYAWRAKARRRGWFVALLTVALGGVVYLSTTN